MEGEPRMSTRSIEFVAATPVFPAPHRSPASTPTFSGLLTPTPTSSNRGCRRTCASTIDPTTPVPHSTIRFFWLDTGPPDSAVEFAAVDGEHLPGDGRGQIAGQEQRRAGDLFGRGQPLQIGRRGLLAVDVVVRDTRLRGEPVEVRLVDVLVHIGRSEEHTSELESLRHLVCRLLLEKK